MSGSYVASPPPCGRDVEPPPLARWIANGWVLAVVAVLLAAEVVLDKVAVVDHVNDAVQTFVRPTVGGLIFAATAAAGQLDASPWIREHPAVTAVRSTAVASLAVAADSGHPRDQDLARSLPARII